VFIATLKSANSICNSQGKVYAIHPWSVDLWTTPFDTCRGNYNFSPVLSNDRKILYVGSQTGCSGTGTVQCGGLLAIATPQTPPNWECTDPIPAPVPPSLVWEFDRSSGSSAKISPEPYSIGGIIGGSTLYVAGSSKVVALVEQDQADCTNHKVCTDGTTEGQSCTHNPAMCPTCVPIEVGYGSADPRCVKWYKELPADPYPPMERNRPVLSNDGDLVYALTRQNAHFFALTSDRGEQVSEFEVCNPTGYSIPAIHAGTPPLDDLRDAIFFGDRSGKLYAIAKDSLQDLDGKNLDADYACSFDAPGDPGHWISDVSGTSLRSTALVSQDETRVFIGGTGGIFRAVRVATEAGGGAGSLDWCFDTMHAPAGVPPGKLYDGDAEGCPAS
jgi:outer membrane protein assembly factor BamB